MLDLGLVIYFQEKSLWYRGLGLTIKSADSRDPGFDSRHDEFRNRTFLYFTWFGCSQIGPRIVGCVLLIIKVQYDFPTLGIHDMSICRLKIIKKYFSTFIKRQNIHITNLH